MITPIRIGGLGLNVSNLCYWREQPGGKLVCWFPGTPLTLEGEEAAVVLRYLKKHSPDLKESIFREPQLPQTFNTQKTTLLIPEGERSDG